MKGYSKEVAVVIFDTAAFLAGLHLLIAGRILTIGEVLMEVKDSYSSERLIYGLEANRIEVKEVGEITVSVMLPENLRKKLSETDLKLIQLAFNEKSSGKEVIVFTDDYAIQQSLSILKIKFKPVRHRGIDS
ncbi:MAG: hypothetical protein ACP5I2_02470 [Fervidicoccaceae archaeon]|jgi:rRNA maturation endonuclease Nob1|uniref:Ribonuclease PIN domain-containing protein n=1 Tax=Fervidicoccus fontis TaxID=683846 RepID=A0A7C2YH63_9CREN|nr:MAG: hypothetical protein C0179_00870 [Fervidicoccus sp.]HEU97557.1 hypothetical protein [Fervidicoccus fontis]